MFAQFNVFIPVKAVAVGLHLFVQPAELSVEQLFVTVMHAPCACCNSLQPYNTHYST